MSQTSALRRTTPQAQASMFKMRQEAQTQKAKLKAAKGASVLASPRVCGEIDRTRLATLLAMVVMPAEADLIPLPLDLSIAERLEEVKQDVHTPDADLSRWKMTSFVGDEDAAIRALALSGASCGRVELWGVRDFHGATTRERFFWATPAAMLDHFPDEFNRVRYLDAGAAPTTGLRPSLVQRFGVFHDERRH